VRRHFKGVAPQLRHTVGDCAAAVSCGFLAWSCSPSYGMSPAKAPAQEDAMNAQVSGAVRQAKVYLFPALIIGGWLALFGSVVAAMSNPVPLQASIEKVLSTKSPAEPAADLVAER